MEESQIKSIQLNQISIDFLNFIQPLCINDIQFRSKWVTLEWENKINLHKLDHFDSVHAVVTYLRRPRISAPHNMAIFVPSQMSNA